MKKYIKPEMNRQTLVYSKMIAVSPNVYGDKEAPEGSTGLAKYAWGDDEEEE